MPTGLQLSCYATMTFNNFKQRNHDWLQYFTINSNSKDSIWKPGFIRARFPRQVFIILPKLSSACTAAYTTYFQSYVLIFMAATLYITDYSHYTHKSHEWPTAYMYLIYVCIKGHKFLCQVLLYDKRALLF